MRIALGLVLGMLACQAPQVPQASDPLSRRTTASGTYEGVDTQRGSYAWLGIPFAQPPVGPLRWRAPQPLSPHEGVFMATAYGEPCVQPPSLIGGMAGDRDQMVGSEDCLTLNIHAPHSGTGDKSEGEQSLPVMVWIHGGANRIGTSRLYNGATLSTEQGVIVVTINYRLGVLGWLRHPGLQTGDSLDDSGNYGTLDIVAALQWVQDNIAGFGGDPNRVTIFGESAGGLNVLSMMTAPPAKGLFHRAIAQSGVTDTTPIDNAPTHLGPIPIWSGALLVERLQAELGVAEGSHAEQAGHLRGADAATLVRLAGGAFEPQHRLFQDGVVLPADGILTCLADADCRHSVPLVVGTNRDEMTTFMAFDPYWVKLAYGLPRAMRDPVDYGKHASLASDYWKLRGADRVAEAAAASGVPVWMYRFDWDEEPTILGLDLSKLFGAAHGFEIPFVFNHFVGKGMEPLFNNVNRERRHALARQMGAYWGSFAATGAPKGSVPWSSWSADASEMIVFDTPPDGGIRMEPSEVSLEELVRRIDTDPHYPNRASRCQEFVRVFGAHDDFDMTRWSNFGCGAHDPATLAFQPRMRTK